MKILGLIKLDEPSKNSLQDNRHRRSFKAGKARRTLLSERLCTSTAKQMLVTIAQTVTPNLKN